MAASLIFVVISERYREREGVDAYFVPFTLNYSPLGWPLYWYVFMQQLVGNPHTDLREVVGNVRPMFRGVKGAAAIA